MPRVAIGSDHAGFALKAFLAAEMGRRGFQVSDLGAHSPEQSDYPSFCIAVGLAVQRKEADWGIVLGGSGQGEQIAANKVKGVRAALCNEPYFALMARKHNDANVLAMGGRVVAPEFALVILDTWIGTPFEGGRHQKRLDQIAAYENET